MSISAAELPEMSRETGSGAEAFARLRARLDAALPRVAFFVVPSAVGFLALGDAIAGVLLQHGALHARRTACDVGHPRRLGGRTRRERARPPLLVHLLRAARHAHAAALRHRARDPHRRCSATCSPSRCRALLGLARVDGRGGTHGVGRASRAGSSSRCCGASITARIGRTGIPPRPLCTALGRRLVAGAAGFGVMQLLCAAITDARAASRRSLPFASSTASTTLALGVPEARALVARVARR